MGEQNIYAERDAANRKVAAFEARKAGNVDFVDTTDTYKDWRPSSGFTGWFTGNGKTFDHRRRLDFPPKDGISKPVYLKERLYLEDSKSRHYPIGTPCVLTGITGSNMWWEPKATFTIAGESFELKASKLLSRQEAVGHITILAIAK